jgi:hypothetical protein
MWAPRRFSRWLGKFFLSGGDFRIVGSSMLHVSCFFCGICRYLPEFGLLGSIFFTPGAAVGWLAIKKVQTPANGRKVLAAALAAYTIPVGRSLWERWRHLRGSFAQDNQ